MAETLANGTIIPQGTDLIHSSGVQAMRSLGGSVDGQLGNRYTKAQADALLAGKARKEPVDLADQDLNDVIDEGPYIQTSSAAATAERNYPANSNGLFTAGFLDVVSRPGDFLVRQIFTAFNGLDTFWRTRYAGAWSTWRRTFRADEAAPVVNRVTALEYDSGWRDVSSLLGEQYISGEFWIRRIGKQIWLHFYHLALAHTGGTSIRPAWNLPIGYRPDIRYAYLPFAPRSGDKPWTTPPTVGVDASGPMRVSRFGVQDIYNISAGQLISADVSFTTSDAVLTPPPGAAVTIF